MDKNTHFAPFNELARFDSLLTRIDPSLEMDAFNKFMTRPDLQQGIAPPQIKMKKAEGSVWSG